MEPGQLVFHKTHIKIGTVKFVYKKAAATGAENPFYFVLVDWGGFRWRHALHELELYFKN